MAKLTKKQHTQATTLVSLMHEIIRAKHADDKVAYEETVVKIKEVVNAE